LRQTDAQILEKPTAEGFAEHKNLVLLFIPMIPSVYHRDSQEGVLKSKIPADFK